MQGQPLPFYLVRDDFPSKVAMNDGEIGPYANKELARPDFRAANCLRRCPAEVNPEAHAFFLNTDPGEICWQRPEDRPQERQGFSRSARQDNPAISFPPVKSQKLNVRDTNVLAKRGVPA